MNSLELDNFKLLQKKVDDQSGALKFISSIQNLEISDKRSIIEHKTAGIQGGVILDQGRSSTVVSISGVFIGEEAKIAVEQLRVKFKAGVPVQMLSNISGIVEINKVIIQDFTFREEQGFQSQYTYEIKLCEYVEPPQDDDSPPDQEEDAEEEVEEEAENTETSVNYITGKVVDPDNKPIDDVAVKISWDGGEFSLKTDDEGEYKTEELEPGKYTVMVDSPEFQDVKEVVEVKKEN